MRLIQRLLHVFKGHEFIFVDCAMPRVCECGKEEQGIRRIEKPIRKIAVIHKSGPEAEGK